MIKIYTAPGSVNSMVSKLLPMSLLSLMFFISVVGKAQSLKGDTWATAQKNGTGNITVAFYETAGLVVKDNAGNMDGLCIDLLQRFVEFVDTKKGIKLNVQYAGNGENFRSFYESVKAGNGGVFGLGNVTITEERKKEINFSVPFITNIAVFMTHENVPTVNKLNELSSALAGKTAYVPKGTTHEKRMLELQAKHFPGMKIVHTTSSMESMEKMLQDKNGYCYQDLALYLEAMKRDNTIKRHAIADRGGENFGFIMPLNSDWTPIFNEFMTSFRKDPQYKQIIVKHLGASAAKMLEKVSN